MSLFGSGKIPYEGDQTISGFIGPTGVQGLRGLQGITRCYRCYRCYRGYRCYRCYQVLQVLRATGSSGFNAGIYTAVDYLSTGRESFIGDNGTGIQHPYF